MKNRILLTLIFSVLCNVSLWSQCTDPNAQFEFYTDTPPIPTIFCEGGEVIIDNKCDETNPPGCIDSMTINWDYPFGTTETFTDFGNRTHIYDLSDSLACTLILPKTYNIQLCVYYDTPGLDNCITKQVKVRPKPVANFIIDDPICINDPSQCVDNISCSDSLWTWSIEHLPNGVPGIFNIEEPCYNFNQLGNYEISLTAGNSCGTDIATKIITVIDTINAQGTISELSACDSLTATLTDWSGNPPAMVTGRTWSITPATGWMYVQNTNQNSQIAKVKFFLPGNYTVSLQVASTCNTSTKVIGIVHIAGHPSATLSGVNGGCLPHSITPSALNVNYDNSNLNNNISWQFPGGMPSSGSGANPGTINYPNAGAFTVTMTVTNECDTVVYTQQIFVGQPADTNVQLNGVPANGCGPFTVVLNNTSLGGNSQWWITPATPGAFTFTNGTSATSVNPEILFNLPGTYTLHFSLIGAGCGSDTSWTSAPIVVRMPPEANIAYIPPFQCAPAIINADTLTNNGGDNTTTWEWILIGGNPSFSSAPDPGPISYTDTGQYLITLIMHNSCDNDTATASFYVADLSPVAFNIPDTVCSYDAPFTIQVTPSGGNCPGYPGCLFDPGQVTPGLHTISYQVGSGNCIVSGSKDIYVAHVVVDAGTDESFCDTLVPVFQLSNQSPLNGVFSGPGVLTPQGLFSVAAAGFGTHVITYSKTDNASGCIFTDTKNITVFEPLTASGAIPTNGCVGTPIPFMVTAADVTLCSWKFGDGSPPVQQCSTSHTYQATGDYQVMLVVENANGCSDTLMQNIHISEPATANFTVEPLSGCAPLQVTFTNESTGEGMMPYWDFGNGDTSNIDSPGSVTYQQGTTIVYYYPTLVISNGCGNTVFTDTIEVLPQPVTMIEISQDTICSGDTILVQNNSLGGPVNFEWQDGKGNIYSSENLPDQVYYTDSLVATYQIVLVASNDCGTTADTVALTVVPVEFMAFFNLDSDTYCQYDAVQITNGATPGTNVSYDFGDQATSDETNPVHVYQESGTYKIIQYARTDCGLDSFFQWITVLPAPVFDFYHEPEVCQNQALTFTASIDPLLSIPVWDFGDGSTSSGIQTFHSYTLSGTYQVTLTVTDIASGCANSDSSTVFVRANPVASFTTADTAGCGSLTVQLTNANDQPGYTHVWSYTPGTNTSVEANPDWLFDAPGWYSVSLITTDDFGCFDDTTAFELIHVNPLPLAAFELIISENCQLPATVQTQNQSTGALGYSWTSSNGIESNFTDTTMVFEQPGDFLLTLIALNEFLCADTTSQWFTIHPEIVANFEVLEQVACVGQPLEINNLSENATSLTWYISNGDTITGDLTHYTFEEEGFYDILLIASLDTFCFDTAFQANTVQVLPGIIADFSYEEVQDTSIVPNGLLEFMDLSNNPISWHWDFGDGGTSSEQNPVHRYYVNGPRIVTLEVTNEYGCSDTIMITIEPDFFGQLYIPNALSPEFGSEGERVFQPSGIGLKEFEIAVYSSDGERVWHSNALENGQPSESWDGTYKGTLLPQGIYWWKVQARFESGQIWQGMQYGDDRVVREGKVLLIR